MDNAVIRAIKSRRSVRKFSDRPLDEQDLQQVLDCGRHAPSGMNNQPWRFAVVREPATLARLAECTKYGAILLRAQAAVAVYLDNSVSYNHLKDCQAVGACCQNMLLAAHALGLGAVWIGEILNRSALVNEIVGASKELELMAVLVLGHPAEQPGQPRRLPLDDLIFSRR